ncbi:MAG: squalene/phytoene synthase family protein [Chloroflexota bacterium]
MSDILSADQKSYLSHYMKGVSRSFSLVAPEVDSPLDDFLAEAYLICRVVDNIEDSNQPFPWQQERFAEFGQLLAEPGRAAAILDRWDGLNWGGLSGAEQEMMSSEKGLMLWQIYAAMPEEFRAPIRRWAGEMALGMERSGNPFTSDFFFNHGDVRLPVLESDYDLYCFYVAGTVGRMITELAVTFYDIEEGTARIMTDGSDACGRALQKTNIVKDFAVDLQRRVSYLPGEWQQEIDFAALQLAGVPAPWKKKVLLNVVRELEASVNYVLALPQTAVGYRKAGLLMMLPAFETILLAARRLEKLFTPDHALKISRAQMGRCVLLARKIAYDNGAIFAYAENMAGQIRRELQPISAGVQ